MAEEEAREVTETIDFILENGARDAEDRARLLKLREEVEHVERTGRWPEQKS